MIPIDLYPGSKIRFTGSSDPGFKHRTEMAKRYLELGEVFTLRQLYKDREGWGYYVYLKEVPNVSFRPELFELVEAVTPPVKKRGRRKKVSA